MQSVRRSHPFAAQVGLKPGQENRDASLIIEELEQEKKALRNEMANLQTLMEKAVEDRAAAENKVAGLEQTIAEKAHVASELRVSNEKSHATRGPSIVVGERRAKAEREGRRFRARAAGA